MPADSSNPPEQSGPAEEPHYHGHRERLRDRFHGAGPDALSDYELLEMVLFSARSRGDVKPLAKTLIKKFGSFAEVIHAPEARLREVDGIGDKTVTQLKLIAAAASRIAYGSLAATASSINFRPAGSSLGKPPRPVKRTRPSTLPA